MISNVRFEEPISLKLLYNFNSHNDLARTLAKDRIGKMPCVVDKNFTLIVIS